MSFLSVLSDAQAVATQVVETVRQRIVLRVQSAPEFGGVYGATLRREVEQIVKNDLRYNFSNFLSDAWDFGVKRAETGHVPSHLIKDTAYFNESVAKGFTALSAAIDKELSNLLHRASLSDSTKEDVISAIGNDAGKGYFKDYTARASGIIEYAMKQAESRAYTEAAKLVAIKQAQAHAVKGALSRKDAGLVVMTMKVWDHSGGGNPPRANHVAMNGKGVPVESKFRLLGRDGVTYYTEGPHAPDLPVGEVANCFPADTLVSGEFEAGTRFLYRGPIRHVKTLRGYTLAVTPNHPIATANGWIAAGKLDKGVNVLTCEWQAPQVMPVDSLLSPDTGFLSPMDNQNQPARIDQVFHALSIMGPVQKVSRTGFEFHGDSQRGESDIEIVYANSELLNAARETISEFGFVSANILESHHGGESAAHLDIVSVPLPAASIPSGGALSLDSLPALSLNVSVPKTLAVRPVPNLDSCFNKLRSQRGSSDTNIFTDLVQRLPGVVVFDEIVEVWDEDFVGHVYDVQSVSGLLIAGNNGSANIIASNCHCTNYTVALHVTPAERTSIISQAAETGGYIDKRWSR